MIEVNGLSKSFDGKNVLDDVSFAVAAGETLGIIGPNGSGKSTLLKLLSGVEQADAGQIRLEGKPVKSYSRKELARWLAVLQQDALPPVGFTVREVVEMGRFPFQNWLGDEPDDQSALVEGIMEQLRLAPFASRSLEHLSGGERQRVALGKVMAQQPRLLLLDEPTTYLDIGYQMQMMDTVRRWQEKEGLTVVAVLHDLNLAAQYCDRLLMIHRGRLVRIGTPWEVLERGLIADVYETEPIVTAHPVTGCPQLLLQPGASPAAGS
ncbi:heme ABC transporter ATP-binding protein [Paenibacillus hodogayensis]|uniref:Heme ABC transporter ATP-binding protein n=1 Tax=Paenibacillus hodogayensis TaxID=279208 RepID=A0ABV5VRP9_9BACL